MVSLREMCWLDALLRLTPTLLRPLHCWCAPHHMRAYAIPRRRTEESQMGHHYASLRYSARREVLAHVAPRYQKVTNVQKMLLLDQIVELTGYERTYAIRLLLKKQQALALFRIMPDDLPRITTLSQVSFFFCSRAHTSRCLLSHLVAPYLYCLRKLLEHLISFFQA